MNYAHLHLLLNHVPVIGSIVGLGLFLISFFGKNEDLRRSSYIIFAAIALVTIPAFLSGFGAEQMIKGPGVSDALISRHEGSALLSLWFMELTGAIALIGLWQSQATARSAAVERFRCTAFFGSDGSPHGKNREHGWRHPPSGTSPGGRKRLSPN